MISAPSSQCEVFDSLLLTTEYSELVPAKPYTGLVPCFYWNPFLNQSPTSIAILLLSLVLASLLKLFLNYRLTLPAVKDQEMAFPALSNWYFPYNSDCGLPEIRPILLNTALEWEQIREKDGWTSSNRNLLRVFQMRKKIIKQATIQRFETCGDNLL